MSRLTEKEIDYLIINGEYSKDADRLIRGAAHELREYRKLEEQGRLIELPCKVGDTVFSVHSEGLSHAVIAKMYADEFFLMLCVAEGRFGKTVFTTKEAAEAKLAEMEGAE